MITRELFRN